MRLRNIPGAEEIVDNCSFCINNPQNYNGQWSILFGNNNPIHLEIGMGKGQFITAMAQAHPEINFIGIERYSSVIIRAIAKIEENPPANLRLICVDARNLVEMFDSNEISRIYLNFSDPWPKDRHAKRRLTSPVFLNLYNQLLPTKGEIHFKTDNFDLFEYSVETISEDSRYELLAVTRDLHNDSELVAGNIMTEYEEKFSSQGNPICKLIASKN